MYKLAIDPLPCPRPKIAVRGRFATAYYPKPYEDWKKACARLLKDMNKPGELEHINLTCHFYRQQPKTTKLSRPRGDVDNYVKSLMDALTTAEWWSDDEDVIKLTVSKSWAPKGQAGYIEFSIKEETLQ